MLRKLPELLGDRDDFVIKPNRGSAGRGVLVITGRDGRGLLRHNGELLRLDDLQAASVGHPLRHVFAGRPAGLGADPAARSACTRRSRPSRYKGIPDVRVILYRNEPAMAMLRLPTKESNGRANLHQGGIGTGVDLADGRDQPRRAAQPVGREAPRYRPAGGAACACRTGTRCCACRGG